jgi:hypothetical protein
VEEFCDVSKSVDWIEMLSISGFTGYYHLIVKKSAVVQSQKVVGGVTFSKIANVRKARL